MMNGLINLLKPPGLTSHDVVAYVRRLYKIKKVGHTGSLDPGATGVLVVCVGRATRIARFITEKEKEYRAEIVFGAVTDTGDAYGAVVKEQDPSFLTEADFLAALPVFTGLIKQVPPMVSALKHQGKRLYELARAGVTVERQARAVTISSLRYLGGAGWGGGRPVAAIQITCSKGTYVRTLCEDLGKHLGCAAHMASLVRTRVGPFSIKEAYSLEDLQLQELAKVISPTETALANLPEVIVKRGAVGAVSAGAKLFLPGVAQMPDGLTEGAAVRLRGPEGLLAVAETGFDPEDRSRIVFKPICVLA